MLFLYFVSITSSHNVLSYYWNFNKVKNVLDHKNFGKIKHIIDFNTKNICH